MPPHRDQIDELLGLADSNYQLSNDEVIDQIITILYSGYESVSSLNYNNDGDQVSS